MIAFKITMNSIFAVFSCPFLPLLSLSRLLLLLSLKVIKLYIEILSPGVYSMPFGKRSLRLFEFICIMFLSVSFE